jgi:uncharacterized protein (TIGR03437 family)
MTVTYAALTPGTVGMYQVTAVAPSNLTAGDSAFSFALTGGGQTAAWIPQ